MTSLPSEATEASSPSARQHYSESVPGAPLESVLCSGELEKRPHRPRNDELQDRAVNALLQRLSAPPNTVLTSLANAILEILKCDSAGVSLINDDRTRFYWPAIAGVWASHVGGGTPLHFGPCGDVLVAGRPLHMKQIHMRYTYFTPVTWVKEVLLVPFYVDGEIRGTIWSVIHDPPNDLHSRSRTPADFDVEDLRLLEVLGGLATAAYKVWSRAPLRTA